MSDAIRALALREQPLSIDEVHAALADPTAGGVAVFVGTVRDHDAGRSVEGLAYSAHPSALDRMREVAEKVAASHDVVGVAAVHRVGELAIGDVSVVVGACAAHRGEAIVACRALIDTLKATVPIWKHQRFTDGTDEWVGTP
jgi:molybdopterin synthase catalytic subunit